MQHYPIILVPTAIKEAKQAIIPFPYEPTKPVEPQKFESSNTGWYFLFISIGIISFIPFIGIVGLIIGIISIYDNISAKNNYEYRKKLYKNNLSEYESKNRTYQYEKAIVLNKRNDSFEVKTFRENQLKKVLSTTCSPEIAHTNLKGKAEEEFLITLNNYFKSHIVVDKVIELFYNSQPYSPDFIFIHKNSNLHIDIEIDEPYVSGTGQPIHYLENDNFLYSIDNSRNSYFMGKGWCVIRFAEEQIVKYPIECCKVIAKVIEDIIEDSTFIKKFSVYEDLPKIKHWTKSESIDMYNRGFRNQYFAEKLRIQLEKLEQEYYSQGKNNYKSKNYDVAIEKLTQAINLNPNKELSYYYRGLSYYHTNKYLLSVIDFKKCIEIKPNDALNYRELADSYRKLEKFELAIENYDKAISIDKNMEIAYFNKSICNEKLGNIHIAIIDISICIELNPNDPINHNKKGNLLYKIKNLEEAIVSYSKAVELKQDKTYIKNRFNIYMELGKYTLAKKDIDNCIRLQDNNPNFYNESGLINRKLGFYTQAIADYDKALSLVPNNFSYIKNRGFAKYCIGDLEDALKDFYFVLSIDPNDSFANETVELIKKALEKLNSLTENTLFNFAKEYFRLGLNITCISNIVNQYNKASKNIYKNPNHSWKHLFNNRQKYSQIVDYSWDIAIGVGTITGSNQIMAIDIDGCNDFKIVLQMLNIIELPADYEWIIRSGSQNGFHIIVQCNKFNNLQKDDVVNSYTPNKEFEGKFEKIEFLWNTHLVLPPSIHISGKRYEFVGSQLPKYYPKLIDELLLKESIKMITSEEKEKVGKGYFV